MCDPSGLGRKAGIRFLTDSQVIQEEETTLSHFEKHRFRPLWASYFFLHIGCPQPMIWGLAKPKWVAEGSGLQIPAQAVDY